MPKSSSWPAEDVLANVSNLLWIFDDFCGFWWIWGFHSFPSALPWRPPRSDLQLRLRFFVRVQLQRDAGSALLLWR
jgi:hypothetical protein